VSDLEAGLVAVFAIVVVILIWHVLTRDKEVRQTRWGVFIERDRYDGTTDDKLWPQPKSPPPPTHGYALPADDETTEQQEPWPKP
jgi:hypothetical protein